MSKKFFSLIYGDKIHQAPKGKVIPADAFSKLMDAQDVLQRIKEEADKYKMDVVKECEEIKENAIKEGFQEGFKQWGDQIALLEKEIAQVRKEIEKLVIPVALKAAKKIVGREMELSEQTIVDIVANVLKAVSQHKKVVIYVNKADLETLETNKARLKQIFENLESLSIREREDVMQGGCIIETEAGIINAQLENQWRTLEQAFEVLMKPKK